MKTKHWLILIVVLALCAGAFVLGRVMTHAPHGQGAAATKYICPMHPTVVSDKKGSCPICGMDLVPMEDDKLSQSTSAAPKKTTMYRSTMNPGEISDKPGKDSMGMEMEAFEMEEDGGGDVPGLAAVTISPEIRQRMGLTLGTVEKRALARDTRTSARIVADETRVLRVSVKIDGWVEKLFVNVTGQEVKKGDPLLTVYSPEMVAAQREYLIALRGKDELGANGESDAKSNAASLQAAARRRLQLWDINDEQIARLEKTREVEKTLTFYSPASGVVTEKGVLAGQKIMPGESLLVVADLSSVWGEADIYQSDLSHVKVGMPVELSLSQWPGKTFKGDVIFVTPTLNPETRTVKARITIANPELLLKPEMYADARLSYSLGEKLAIPEAAVMRTGEHTYAFRDGEDGRLIPAEIKLGARSDGYYELLSGLNEGDKVVTSANFLVDSESSISAARAAMAGGKKQ